MNYTSIEQSKHLLELGLSPETADMFYNVYADGTFDYYSIGENWNHKFNKDDIPCWSVGALLDVLDYPKFYKNNTSGKDLWHCRCYINEREIIKESFAETQIDAVVELVTHLLEFGILKNKRNYESRRFRKEN